VFTHDHALEAGFGRHQIRHRCESGAWIAVHENVLRIAGAPRTWRGDLLAACWAGGYRTVATGRSAAALHGLPGGRQDIVEVLCPRWRRTQHAGLVVHESKAIDALDLTVVDGIPCASVARTLLGLAAAYPRGRTLELAFEHALRRDLVTIPEMQSMLRRLGRSGRPGVRALRLLVEARSPGRAPTESEMETALLQAIRAHGLPEPVPQFVVRCGAAFIARVDFAYPDARVAIEYDSDEFHTGRVATQRDRRRRHALVAAGWLPIDAGAGDLRDGGPHLVAAVRQALVDRQPTVPASTSDT
jgi:very-short-patch-repair endonuclease